ncbi:MAG: hypothetical protein JJV88_02740 [Sulfurovum sp.]|nr:hypothetical protein [Sulfurovaceae bacterium]
MNDGVAQFENIAKEYISKISDLENLEKREKKHSEELEQAKKEALEEGRKSGEIKLIKNIYETFPTKFLEIKESFSEHLSEKFTRDEVVTITTENQNKLLPYLKIEGEMEMGEYVILAPALLLDGDILVKAEVKLKEIPKEMIQNTEKRGDK